MKYVSFILIVVLLVFSFPTKTYAGAPTDYVSCWNLDESSTGVGAVARNDSNTTNHNNLTDNNTTESATGVVSNGANFKVANTEALTIADASQTGLDFTGDRTFSAWIKPTSQPSNDGYALISKWGASNAQYNFVYNDSAGIKTIQYLGYQTCGGSNVNYVSRAVTATTSAWTHFVVRFDAVGHASGNGTAEFFVNGVSIGTVTDGTYTGGANCTGTFSLSGLGGSIQWFTNGVQDVTEVYDRLLTDAEITSLYNGGAGVSCDARTQVPVYSKMNIMNDISLSNSLIIQ